MELLDTRGHMAEAAIVATRVGACLVITAPSELGGTCLEDIERETLSRLGQAPARGLIFELSGVQFMDSYEFIFLQRIAQAAKHLGARPIFSGIRPGIVAHLANSGCDAATVSATLGLNEALALFAVAHDK